jgi:hypothetical protein
MEVRALYNKGSFPPTNHLGGVGCTIEGCWRGGYLDAVEIAAELEGMYPALIQFEGEVDMEQATSLL